MRQLRNFTTLADLTDNAMLPIDSISTPVYPSAAIAVDLIVHPSWHEATSPNRHWKARYLTMYIRKLQAYHSSSPDELTREAATKQVMGL